MRRIVGILSALVVVGVFNVSAMAAAQIKTVSTLRVVFEAPRGSVPTNGPTMIRSLVKAITDANSGYLAAFSACARWDATSCTPGSFDQADIDVVSTFGPPDDTTKKYPLTLFAYVTTERIFPSAVAFTVDSKTTDLNVSSDQWQQLLGTPIYNDGQLTVASYSTAMQLVPETATDRKYLGVLASYFARQKIQTVSSQFTGVDTTNASLTGAATQAQICLHSPRYFHYGVSIRAVPLFYGTRMQTISTGQVIDCVDPGSRIAMSSSDRYNINTIKAGLLNVIGLASLLYVSKSNSWTGVSNVGSSVAGLVDSEPTSTILEANIYDAELGGLVTKFCRVTLAEALPTIVPAEFVQRVNALPNEQYYAIYALLQKGYVSPSQFKALKKVKPDLLEGLKININLIRVVTQPPAPSSPTPAASPAKLSQPLIPLQTGDFVSASPPSLVCAESQ